MLLECACPCACCQPHCALQRPDAARVTCGLVHDSFACALSLQASLYVGLMVVLTDVVVFGSMHYLGLTFNR